MSTPIRDFVGNELNPGDVIAIPIRYPGGPMGLEAWEIVGAWPEGSSMSLRLRKFPDKTQVRQFSNFSDCVKICVPDGSQP